MRIPTEPSAAPSRPGVQDSFIRLPHCRPASAKFGNGGSACKASSDSSLASAASSIQLTSQGIDSPKPEAAAVPGSSALQPRSSVQYANSRNGLTLHRVSVSTKKAQRRQQHLIQHTLHQQPAHQCHPLATVSSPCPAAVPVLQACQQTPDNQTLSGPLFTPLVSHSTPIAAAHRQSKDMSSRTACQLAGSTTVKRKLPSSGTAAKRARTVGRQMQSPSRSKKLQRLGNELYSSSGKGTLLRKGSRRVSRAGLKAPAEGSQPVAKATTYARQGRQLVRLTPSMAKAISTRGIVKPRQPSSIRRNLAAARLRAPIKMPQQCLLYSRTGKCEAAKQGRCNCLHDPKKITICGRWLRGTCSRPNCPLQHCLQPHLLPVCTFFLQGMCSKEDCPYLHVNLDPAAPVCRDFVRGYCPRGAVCPHKHLTPKMVRELRASKSLSIGCLASSRKVPMHGSQPKPSPTLASLNSDLMKPAFLRDLDDEVLDRDGLRFNLD
ncbi:hypothetical protein WJX74_011005 [Apatococcus lobatus]|uniref:C3H1-type domain-containing protein n=1 Tax=Apatococcus lobatus TaxID=904363 RepID=A0AAW1SH41_9CHLO